MSSCSPPLKRSMGVVVVDVADEQVEVLVKEHLFVAPAGDLADDPGSPPLQPAPHDLHEIDHVFAYQAAGQSQEAQSPPCEPLPLSAGKRSDICFFEFCDLSPGKVKVLECTGNHDFFIPQGDSVATMAFSRSVTSSGLNAAAAISFERLVSSVFLWVIR